MDNKMEAVQNFNSELSSLYDFKVPISKAKMAGITKSAMKAIKFYKHVVQSVEKFILKCKPEYKIPALYVIDSIVRQSRHQFGTEKDVFAPRFARNMEETFAHLFRCSNEDKSKIIRVLNLWQKNNVFAPDVIQPLFDLANPDHPVHQAYKQQQQQNELSNGMNTTRESPMPGQPEEQQQTGEILSALNIQKFQLQQMMMQQQQSATDPMGNNNNNAGSMLDAIKFNKQLLEYDYGSENDEDKGEMQQLPQHQNPLYINSFSQMLSDPNVLKQLQNLQKDMTRHPNEMPGASNLMYQQQQPQSSGITLANINSLRGPQSMMDKDQDVEIIGDMGPVEVINIANSRSPTPNRYRRKKSRSRSRDRDRRERRRRTRSKSRSKSRSRSPRSRRRSSRDRVKEKEREIEKERRRKGLPDVKKDHLSVCSTTLWVGHLSKLVQQEELSDTFGKYGDIVSIDMIPPRGCAYIVMNRRQDAHKAMQSLKNHKMQGRTITISWAAGKGVKSKEWKDYFDQTLGVSYIPWGKLNQLTDFETIEEGGMYDEDTMPVWVKDKLKQPQTQATVNKDMGLIQPFFGLPTDVTSVDTSQPPPTALMQGINPFSIGGIPRLMGPVGIPMTGLSLGVPPPNMLVPGMGIQFPPMDKSMTRSLLGFAMAGTNAAPPSLLTNQQQQSNNDDHMDIEMEDENQTLSQAKNDATSQLAMQQAFFNHPPPTQLGMAALMMGASQAAAQSNESQNNDDYGRSMGRNDRSRSREKDRGDFRRDNRRSVHHGDFNSRNNRWPSDSNGRRPDNRDRSRDGPSQNSSYGASNRRGAQQQPEIPSLLSQPMPLLNDEVPSRSRNNDFNMSRDDFDRRQGFNNSAGRGFQPQARGRGESFRGAFGRAGCRGSFDSNSNNN